MTSLTHWVAIYGALVATGMLVWSIVKNRPRIKIEIWGISDKNRKGYTVTIIVINRSDYPIKLDYYGFRGKAGGKNVVSIYDTDDQIIEVPKRDQYKFEFKIDDLKIEFKDGTVYPHKFFYVVARTGKRYEKRIPKYIVKQAICTHVSSRYK